MDTSSLLNEGFNLMLFGVGFVFVFLTLLVIITSLMSWIIVKYEKNVGTLPEDGIPAPTTFISPHTHEHAEHPQSDSNASLLTIISAAVHKYRSRDKK